MTRDMVPLASTTAYNVEPTHCLAGFDLVSADQELAMLRALGVSGAKVRVVPARRRELMDALEHGGFDLLHLISHGAFGGPSRRTRPPYSWTMATSV